MLRCLVTTLWLTLPSIKPLFDSTIGQHLRHILDLYMALIEPHGTGNINYDIRRRGIALEHQRAAGIAELRQVKLLPRGNPASAVS